MGFRSFFFSFLNLSQETWAAMGVGTGGRHYCLKVEEGRQLPRVGGHLDSPPASLAFAVFHLLLSEQESNRQQTNVSQASLTLGGDQASLQFHIVFSHPTGIIQ